MVVIFVELCYLFVFENNLQKQPFAAVFQKGVLKNFVIFTGKHMCWSLFIIKLQAFRPVNIANFSEQLILLEHLQWLLLNSGTIPSTRLADIHKVDSESQSHHINACPNKSLGVIICCNYFVIFSYFHKKFEARVLLSIFLPLWQFWQRRVLRTQLNINHAVFCKNS